MSQVKMKLKTQNIIEHGSRTITRNIAYISLEEQRVIATESKLEENVETLSVN